MFKAIKIAKMVGAFFGKVVSKSVCFLLGPIVIGAVALKSAGKYFSKLGGDALAYLIRKARDIIISHS